jgi:hypothetical protein
MWYWNNSFPLLSQIQTVIYAIISNNAFVSKILSQYTKPIKQNKKYCNTVLFYWCMFQLYYTKIWIIFFIISVFGFSLVWLYKATVSLFCYYIIVLECNYCLVIWPSNNSFRYSINPNCNIRHYIEQCICQQNPATIY